MIIDAHQHFWRYNPTRHDWIDSEMNSLKRDFMPPDLKTEMDNAGVDGCVAVQADQTEQETAFLLTLADQYNFIKGIVGWLDLQADDIEDKLDQYHQHKFLKGLRHTVQDEPDDRFLLRPDFMHSIKLLKGFDLCYDVLIFPRHLPATVEFISSFPDQKFVLDHIAKPEIKKQKIGSWEAGLRELADHPNMYCKISGMVTEANWGNWTPEDLKPYLDVVFDSFGPEKLMFGSDWPVCKLAAEYEAVVSLVKNYINPLPQKQQEMIMGGNAREFYNL